MDLRIWDQNAQYSSPRAILGVAIPACILNSAAPVTALVQASLLGNYVGTSALGAFGAVSITAGFATRVFNFLVDGVSAKTGKSVGLRAWGLVAARVRMSLGFALAAGALAAFTLSLLIRPVSVNVLKLTPEVQAEAQYYWYLRVALVPVMLLNMSVSGILQGFRHVRTSAMINTFQAIAEMVGSFHVLRFNIHIGGHDGLLAMGIVTIITQVVALIAGLFCIFTKPPPEAPPEYSLWKELINWDITRIADEGRASGTGSEEDDTAALRAPLLGGNNNDNLAGGQLGHSRAQNGLVGDLNKDKLRQGSGNAQLEGADSLGSTVYGHLNSVGRMASGDGEVNGEVSDGPPIVYIIDGRQESGGSACPPLSPVSESPSEGEPGEDESLLDFVRDGFNMFVRSMILQMTFFASLVAASRLGTDSLAAHSVINQLWVLISYAVDGFAAAGIVLGSRLAAQAHDPFRAASAKRHLQILIHRVLGAGFGGGVLAAFTFGVFRNTIINMFTNDPDAAAVLRDGVWTVLVAAQPINGLVFVYDGLMYASQSFTFIRNYMLAGFFLVFCPLLTIEIIFWDALWGVWIANAAINAWRAAGAAYLIHFIFMREFDTQLRPSRDASRSELEGLGTQASDGPLQVAVE